MNDSVQTASMTDYRTRPCLTTGQNRSDPFHIGNDYGGIPVNLVTNLIGLLVLLLLFFIFRKSALRKVSKKVAKSTLDGVDAVTTKWTHLLFGGDTNHDEEEEDGDGDGSGAEDGDQEKGQEEAKEKDGISKDQRDCNQLTTSYGSTDQTKPEEERLRRASAWSMTSSLRKSSRMRGAKVFIQKEKSLEPLMGEDAVQYLRFQKYITIYVLITTLVSCGSVLPVNLQGTLQGNVTDFGHTTMANLDPGNSRESNFLWLHISLSFLLFPLAIFLMRRFSIGLRMQDTSLGVTRTIAIENIPYFYCSVDHIRAHFREAYENYVIKDIQLAYDVSKLTLLCSQLRDLKDARQYTLEHNRRYKTQLEMYPVNCARCCFCFCIPCSNRVSCLEYYDNEIRALKAKIEECRARSLHTKLGMAFVTFQSINAARQVYRDHKYSVLNFKHRPPISAVGDLKPAGWKVWYAPPPADIIWENLSDKRELLLMKKVCSNLFLFLICFFLTTPQLIVSQLDPILNVLKNLTEPKSFSESNSSVVTVSSSTLTTTSNTSSTDDTGTSNDPSNNNNEGAEELFSNLPSLITNFLPTLMLWSFTALLPVVVAYSDRLLGHWTRSGENHAVMKKTFWYLICMVIILPTFGLTSGQAALEFLFRNFNYNNSESDIERWDCIFLPDSGAFFINYVITAALIGSGLELIRFPDMFLYLIQIFKSRNKSETPAIRRAITYEFQFGEHYARMMMVFAMVVMYSIICPLITPFGCLFFLLKNLVDRHNLAYVYAPSKINKKIHATAIHFVIMSVALMQFLMVVFTFIRSGNLSSGLVSTQTKVAVILFVLTLNIASAQIWSATCKKISPIKYDDVLLAEEEEENVPLYIPDVLKGPGEGYIDGYRVNAEKLREAEEMEEAGRKVTIVETSDKPIMAEEEDDPAKGNQELANQQQLIENKEDDKEVGQESNQIDPKD